MRRGFAVVIIAAVLSLCFSTQRALADQILVYNGDWSGWGGIVINQLGGQRPGGAFEFDDFLVPTGGWTVTGFMSKSFFNGIIDPLLVTGVGWDIRSGVSEGNGGVPVASGTATTNFTVTFTGVVEQYAGTEVELRASNVTTVPLAPGTYWLCFYPVLSSTATFQSFLHSTSGANAIGVPLGNNGQSYFYEPGVPTAYFAPIRIEDYSYGLEGVTGVPVPEPASLLLLGTGLVGLARWRRRRG